jgi:hypothetical protein
MIVFRNEGPPIGPPRIAGLLKEQLHFEPEAFAPMTAEELEEFDGRPVFPPVRQA